MKTNTYFVNDIIITGDNQIAKILAVRPGNDLDIEIESTHIAKCIDKNTVISLHERECVNIEKCDICGNEKSGHYKHYYNNSEDIVCNKCSKGLYNFKYHYNRKLNAKQKI